MLLLLLYWIPQELPNKFPTIALLTMGKEELQPIPPELDMLREVNPHMMWLIRSNIPPGRIPPMYQ
jgi:hypothetical protein